MVDVGSGRSITRVEPGRDGFVRGVLRTLNRIRKLDGLPQDAPFVLRRFTDGRLSLTDPSTGEEIQLVGFGLDNFNAFDELASAASGGQP